MQKTRSEITFEHFLKAQGLEFRPIATGPEKTPDYAVNIGGTEIVFEVKEMTSDKSWNSTVVHSASVGNFIRKLIHRSRKQVQAASKRGRPTVLLVFNNWDPLQLFGTDDHDFRQAMFGADTMLISNESHRVLERFYGDGKALHASKNTSFSALGRLKQGRGDRIGVTLFENIHAKVPLDYKIMPDCFDVVRGPRLLEVMRLDNPQYTLARFSGRSRHQWWPRSQPRGCYDGT